MNKETKICNNCGAVCDISDTYCLKCLQSFEEQDEADKPIIAGIDNEDLKNFIGKKSEYYLGKFDKARNKKVFIQFNLSALLFGPTWFFYRKMYKFAMIYAVILLSFYFGLSVAMPVIFEADVDRYYDAVETYNDYVNSDAETYIYDRTDGYSIMLGKTPEYQEICDNLDDANGRISLIKYLITVPVLVVNIAFRLFANCFYRKYVTSNINSSSKGGTSDMAAILGLIGINVVKYAISFLLLLIPQVFYFQNAIERFFY